MLDLAGHVEYRIVCLLKVSPRGIWVEAKETHHPCMAYHPDAGSLREHGMNPEKPGVLRLLTYYSNFC